jgi:hypothetical protein
MPQRRINGSHSRDGVALAVGRRSGAGSCRGRPRAGGRRCSGRRWAGRRGRSSGRGRCGRWRRSRSRGRRRRRRGGRAGRRRGRVGRRGLSGAAGHHLGVLADHPVRLIGAHIDRIAEVRLGDRAHAEVVGRTARGQDNRIGAGGLVRSLAVDGERAARRSGIANLIVTYVVLISNRCPRQRDRCAVAAAGHGKSVGAMV